MKQGALRSSVLLILFFVFGASSTAQDAKSGTISFIGVDQNIYLLDPDTLTVTPVTEDARFSRTASVTYQYPTWSRKPVLAFVRYEQSTDSPLQVAIGRYDSSDSLELVDELGGVAPFYLYYSPDGRYLSALGNAPSAGALGLILLAENERVARVVDLGQPYYWAWLDGSEEVLVHTGGFTPNDRIYIKSMETGESSPIPAAPGAFQSPAIAPTGRLGAVSVSEGREGSRLVVSDRDATTVHSFPPFRGTQLFDWSPTEELLAVVEATPTPIGISIGELKLIDFRGSGEPTVWETGIVDAGPCFWSRDGKRIAVFRPSLVGRGRGRPAVAITIDIYEIADKSRRRLVRYLADRVFLTQIAPFYDQYQRSATIWSPDSQRIVVCATSQLGVPTIFVIDVDEEIESPLNLPEGSLPVSYWPTRYESDISGVYPFWSWSHDPLVPNE